MNKVSRLRQVIQEQYENDDLENAAETGEALLREHMVNDNEKSMPFADDLFNLAVIYESMGVYDRAFFLYCESARAVMETDGETVAFSYRLNNLAALLNALGYSENAYHLLLHATAIMRAELSPGDADLADSLYNTANAAADLGRVPEAMRLHKEALKIRKTADTHQNGTSTDIANSLLSMAFIHENAKDDQRAMQCAADALAKTPEDEYFITGYYLAGLCDACEQFDQSAELYRGVLKWVEEQCGREHSMFMNVSLRLGHALAQADRPQEALDVFTDIHDRFLEKNGETHLFYANCLRSMGILYRQLNRPDEAERLMLKFIRIRLGGDEAQRMEDELFLLDMYLEEGMEEKALDWLVYMLMKHSARDKNFLKSMVKQKKLTKLIPVIERMNNRASLAPIIGRWEKWEKGE